MIFGLIFGGIIVPIIAVIWIGAEMHDKEYRKQAGLPPKRYHDIVDLDVTYTYNLNSPPQKRTTILDVLVPGSSPRKSGTASSRKSSSRHGGEHEHDWY